MPTLDIRGRDIQDLANDATLTVQGLTVNFSSLYPLSQSEARKLAAALELARRAASMAVRRVTATLTGAIVPAPVVEPARSVSDAGDMHAIGGLGAAGVVVMRALATHCKVPALSPAQGKAYGSDPGWAAWLADATMVRTLLAALEIGLHSPLTLSDARAQAIRAFMADARATKGQFTDTTNAAAIGMMTAHGNPTALAQLRGQVEQHKAAHDYAGYVRVRREAQTRMETDGTWAAWAAKSPAVRVPADDKGSIHLDFSALDRHPRLYLAYMILHEAAHKFCFSRDHAYADEPGYDTLTKASALMNADSIGFLAVSLYKLFVFRNRQHMLGAGQRIDLES